MRGLAKGAGSNDQVASPTFTISKVYHCPGDIRINHFDFYRLNDPGLMRAELGESVSDPTSVTIVEWADIVTDVLPLDKVIIEITTTGEDQRLISVRATGTQSYMAENLGQT